jgi:hypothetical protein
MWKRLSEPEIARFEEKETRRRRRRLGGPLLTAMLISLAITTLWMLGYRGGRVSSGVMLFSPGHRLSVGDLLVFAVSFATTFLLAYRHQCRTGRGLFAGEASVICNQCQQVSDPRPARACACGGLQEPLDHWEWVDERD